MDQKRLYEWYGQYKDGIFRYALSITKDPQLAEDVLQDTFLKVLAGESPRDPDRARPWLYRVARNLCLDHLRRAKREQPHTKLPAQEQSPYAYIELISALSPKDQQIVTLKIVGGLTHGEIGTVLGMSAKAVQKRYERAIAALRKQEE